MWLDDELDFMGFCTWGIHSFMVCVLIGNNDISHWKFGALAGWKLSHLQSTCSNPYHYCFLRALSSIHIYRYICMCNYVYMYMNMNMYIYRVFLYIYIYLYTIYTVIVRLLGCIPIPKCYKHSIFYCSYILLWISGARKALAASKKRTRGWLLKM